MTGTASVGRLTARQKEILRLVAQGYTSKQIARRLSLSPSTIDNHILAAVNLLEAGSRAEAARWLVEAESRQNLPSHPEPLSKSAKTEDRLFPGRERWRSRVFHLPPIGGGVHDLGWATKTGLVLRIAIVALAAATAMTLIIAGVLKVIGRAIH